WAREAGIHTPMLPAPDFGIDQAIGILADTPNVYFKFTEINVERLQEGGLELAPLLRRMADIFGAQRLVWGSDVGQSLKWPYSGKLTHAWAAAALLDADERALFLHDNAARIYGTTRTLAART